MNGSREGMRFLFDVHRLAGKGIPGCFRRESVRWYIWLQLYYVDQKKATWGNVGNSLLVDLHRTFVSMISTGLPCEKRYLRGPREIIDDKVNKHLKEPSEAYPSRILTHFGSLSGHATGSMSVPALVLWAQLRLSAMFRHPAQIRGHTYVFLSQVRVLTPVWELGVRLCRGVA